MADQAGNVASQVGDEAQTMNLWLDDIRDPATHGQIGWHWVKTARDAIALLATGRVEKASLDHDLTIAQTIGNDDGEDTGFTVVEWMSKNRVWPKGGTKVHSMNPTGRAKMEAAIARFSQ